MVAAARALEAAKPNPLAVDQYAEVFTRAVGRLDSADGPVALTAAALFIQVPLEHFTTHGRPEDVDRAREDRAVRRSVDNLEVNP